MIYRFDYFKRYEEPQLVLCQPTDKEIGIINNPIDLKLEINFNDISTLTYKIYNNDEELTEVGEIGGVEKDWIPSPSKPNIYRLHKERRQVHALGVGYFIIDSITETEDSTGTYKNVTCKSCESELNNIVAPGVALKEVNMYPLYNDIYADKINNYERFKYLDDITTSEVSDDDTGVYVSESCILFNILSYAPSWRLSDDCVNRFESDPKYRELASTLRNFNDEDSTVYSFLRDKIAEAYECVVLFNIEDRTIDIKTYDDVFAQSTMILSESNILDKCEVKTDINDYVNSLTVEGGSDNLFISDFTPDGTNVVYNFSHDLASGMIEGELAEALRYWENATSDLSKVTIERATGLPLQVYPDSFEGYEGNDLYQFLYASRKAIFDWIEGYNSAKANNIAYSEILPPDVVIHVAGNTDWETAEKGEYKFTVKKAFSSSDIIHFGWDTLYSNNDNTLKTITPYSASDSNLSDDAKLVAQAERIKTQIYNLGLTLPFDVLYTSGDNFFVLKQKTAGIGVPYVEITNSDYNISGTLLFEMQNPGYAASSTMYSSFITDTTYDGGVAKIVTKGCGWIEAYQTQDIEWELSEANKVLSYLGQEREDAESCYNLINGLTNSLTKEIETLEQEEQMSGYDFGGSISENESAEVKVHREQYSIAKQYKNLYEKFAQAFLGIRTQLDSWIGTLKNKIYEATEGRKFQGAFKNFYTEEKGIQDADEAQRKAVNLYNQLTRVLRMQSFKDDTIITTDEMKMYEIFDQEQALYNKATNTLAKLVQPNADITIDAEPFIFNEEYKGVTDNIDMGYCIYIELPNGEVPMYHLNQITIDYGAPSCQLTFGDRIRSSDPADIFGELQKTASTAANIVASERIDWGVKTSAINYLMKEKDADIATTFRAMANSVNNVKLDSEGLSCFTVNPSTGAEEYGFRGANGTLMFIEKDTEGNQVPKMAIGRIYRSDGSVEYGLYGDRILANTITADKLKVGTVTTGSNYIKNGAFIGGTGSNTGGAGNLSYWYNYSNDTALPAADYRNSTLNPPVGKFSLIVSAGSKIKQTTETLSSDKYTLSYYYRFENTSGTQVTAEVYIGNSGTPISKTHTRDNNNINTWNKGVLTVELSTATTVTVAFSSTTGISYINGVMLAKGGGEFGSGEYTPYISETYATYTDIDNTGIKIYDGNITIYKGGERKIYTEGNNFYVKGRISAEYLTATAGGDFSGWKFDSTTLYKDTGSGNNHVYKYGLSTDSNRPAIWIGESRTNTWPANGENGWAGKTTNAAKFLVTQEGVLYATDAHIKGDITATSLKLGEQTIQNYISSQIPDVDIDEIGGWSVTSTGLKAIDSDTYTLLLRGNPTQNTDAVIKAGDTNNTYFQVNADGSVTCNSLTAGSITVSKKNAEIKTYVSNGAGLGGYYDTEDEEWVDGSWIIGTRTLYTRNTGWDDSDSHYTTRANRFLINAASNFYVDEAGNVFSLGTFHTGDTVVSGTPTDGIEMSSYNLYFRSKDVNWSGDFKYYGAISPAGTGSLAISAISTIYFGNKSDSYGNKDSYTRRISIDVSDYLCAISPCAEGEAGRSAVSCVGLDGYHWDSMYAKNYYVFAYKSGNTSYYLKINAQNKGTSADPKWKLCVGNEIVALE